MSASYSLKRTGQEKDAIGLVCGFRLEGAERRNSGLAHCLSCDCLTTVPVIWYSAATFSDFPATTALVSSAKARVATEGISQCHNDHA